MKEKKAVLKTPFGQPDVRGPFAWVGQALRERIVAETLRVKSISLEGRKEIDKIQANVVRAMIETGNDHEYRRHDFLFDAKSKRLAGIWVANENEFDLETAPERNVAAEEKVSTVSPIASWQHEITVGPKLDASDFSLTPPAGYAFEAIAKPTITEDEMVAYLGAALADSTTVSSPTRRMRHSTARNSTRPPGKTPPPDHPPKQS